MERKITVLSNKGANQVVINSTATTLGELKTEMTSAGVNYTDMSIFEGISKTELMDDASILPSNLPYKGTVTNDLVILLSTKNKKITSGASAREAAYSAIKSNNLQAAIQTKFGRNFTQVSTVDLAEFVAGYEKKQSSTTDTTIKAETKVEKVENKSTCDTCPCKQALEVLIENLYDEDIIGFDTLNKLDNILNGNVEVSEKIKEAKISTTEVNDMFAFISK